MVRELRDRTGAAMMDCKKALEASNGDMEGAEDHLRKQGLKTAAKKASRETREGQVRASVSADGKTGSLVALACETDFVAATEDFQTFLGELADTARETLPGSIQGDDAAVAPLLASNLVGRDGKVEARLTEVIGKLGENLRISGAARFEVAAGIVGSYVHHNRKAGALVAIRTSAPREKAEAFARQLSQHCFASQPSCLERSQVPAEDLERERAVLMESEDLASKPMEVREKIVTGRLERFYESKALLEQPWIHDPKSNVTKVLAAELGPDAAIEHFALLQV